MFLRNTWYVAAWAKDVGREMTGRVYLNEPVVLYRKENGIAVAVSDRCPHRFAPLHMGQLKGDAIECPYHGLRFDDAGSCVLNPHGDGKIPSGARLRSYPLVERHSLIWIWMGDAAKADASLIPDYGFLSDDTRGTVGGYLAIEANYELLTDNLMDLSHGQFLHASFMQTNDFVNGKHEVLQVGTTVHSNQWVPNGSPQAAYGSDLATGNVDQWWDIRWMPPSVMVLEVGMTPVGQPRDAGKRTLSAHLLTPETETSTHYHFANSRDFRTKDPEMDERIRAWQRGGFAGQDKPMIEAIQKMMGTTDLMSLRPVLLPVDSAAVRARRILAGLVEAENAREPGRKAEAAVA
ncbi:MAG: aromatic ring-hydroxylating dioxygenase subunit alpha [Rhodospirillales bacterium]|nr:aromatic ring-hydroxylating dioxygenase subunit alpha [Rhodospirillales bacterium]